MVEQKVTIRNSDDVFISCFLVMMNAHYFYFLL